MTSTDSRLGPRIRGVMVAASCNGELRLAACIRHCQDGNPRPGRGHPAGAAELRLYDLSISEAKPLHLVTLTHGVTCRIFNRECRARLPFCAKRWSMRAATSWNW